MPFSIALFMLLIKGTIQKNVEKNPSMIMIRENANIEGLSGDTFVQIDLLLQGKGVQSLFAQKGHDYLHHIRGKHIEIHIKD